MTENQQKAELTEQLEEYKKEELVWQKKESKRTVLLSAIGLLISLICGTVISVHIIKTGTQTKAEDTALYFFLLSGGFSVFHMILGKIRLKELSHQDSENQEVQENQKKGA